MIDLKFIQFYVESMYNKSIEEYFNINKVSVSHWRSSNLIPELRMLQFKDREGTLDIKELFSKNESDLLEEELPYYLRHEF